MKNNKTILIIGATSDIAIAVAYRFALHGYNLQLAARNTDDLNPIVTDIKIKYGVDVFLHQLDILNYAYFPTFISSLNTLPDTAICAVGLLGDQEDCEQSIERSSVAMRSNYEGPSLLLGEIANHFEIRRAGTIIGISSVAGERGRGSNYIYGSAKAGFTAFLSGLRNRMSKSNVRVITVIPGFVHTQMTKDMNLPSLLTLLPETLSYRIFKNLNREIIYSSKRWYFIMLIIKLIPEKIFKRLKL